MKCRFGSISEKQQHNYGRDNRQPTSTRSYLSTMHSGKIACNKLLVSIQNDNDDNDSPSLSAFPNVLNALGCGIHFII